MGKEDDMNLYLVQHAEAKKEDEDPLRPLSEKGIFDIQKIALYLSMLSVNVDAILHSPKLRAKQTAEILFRALKPMGGLSEAEGLSPLDEPSIIAERLKDTRDSLIMVGHLPHLGRLASLLLCKDYNREIISFKMAGIVCLKRDEGEKWSLQWMLTPEVVIGHDGIRPSCDSL
jgi:phosphohistidine phosphatase